MRNILLDAPSDHQQTKSKWVVMQYAKKNSVLFDDLASG